MGLRLKGAGTIRDAFEDLENNTDQKDGRLSGGKSGNSLTTLVLLRARYGRVAICAFEAPGAVPDVVVLQMNERRCKLPHACQEF
ncbi:unnamed protein product [Arabis nemorensis]|uniref:Uncharacterized protein n=1 Tax=Arabis nemorensis TaxID=586526 RepID=A0A565C957_9BRAS|nr:unnamed protein product [Arabis nemorensis]